VRLARLHLRRKKDTSVLLLKRPRYQRVASGPREGLRRHPPALGVISKRGALFVTRWERPGTLKKALALHLGMGGGRPVYYYISEIEKKKSIETLRLSKEGRGAPRLPKLRLRYRTFVATAPSIPRKSRPFRRGN